MTILVKTCCRNLKNSKRTLSSSIFLFCLADTYDHHWWCLRWLYCIDRFLSDSIQRMKQEQKLISYYKHFRRGRYVKHYLGETHIILQHVARNELIFTTLRLLSLHLHQIQKIPPYMKSNDTVRPPSRTVIFNRVKD